MNKQNSFASISAQHKRTSLETLRQRCGRNCARAGIMAMKKLILLIAVTFQHINTDAQNWLWAKHAGGTGLDGASSICTDNSNNVYVGGAATGVSIMFDTINVNCSNTSMILAKYDLNGNVIWVNKANGTAINTPGVVLNYAGADKIASDLNGFIYVAGTYTGNAIFGATTLNGFGSSDAFLAKYNSNGVLIWVKNFGGGGFDKITGLVTDTMGNCYVTGVTEAGNAYFPGIMLTASFSGDRAFIAKFSSSNGFCTWAKRTSTLSSSNGVSISGNKLYWIGSFNSIFNFDTVTVTENDSNKTASFYAQLDTAGNMIWIHNILGTNLNFLSVSSDLAGNVTIAGYYQDSINFYGNLYFATNHDAFLFKVNNAGFFQWVTRLQATLSEAYDVKTSPNGDIYFSGMFNGVAQFGAYSVASLTTYSAFIAKFNSNGSCIGMMQGTLAYGKSISLDLNDNCCLGGYFYNTSNFGSFNLSTYGNHDMFIAKASNITGIGSLERTSNNQLLIYANPTAGKCNITVPDDFLHEQNLTLTIYDNAGKVIQQKTVNMAGDKIKINLEAEAKGVYNVTLSNRVKSYSGKIVFE